MDFKECEVFAQSQYFKEGHVQGIAYDGEYMYYSFTTLLVKAERDGRVVGSVRNLAGHLGCITYVPEKRAIFGSLELKHDAIGMGIINRTGNDPSKKDSFYLVAFDIDKITKENMDAERDGVMSAMYLRDVCRDYSETDEVSGKLHRYGCSGIDGTGYGRAFGADEHSEKKLMVAYGIYSDTERGDNDHQILLEYSLDDFYKYATPLTQSDPHTSGPVESDNRYFFFTGNTVYGVQNLEYDAYSGSWMMAVYRGRKDEFCDFSMFFADSVKKPHWTALKGRAGQCGNVIESADIGEIGKQGIRGSYFKYGSTGMVALGNGQYLFSEPLSIKEEKSYASRVFRYDISR